MIDLDEWLDSIGMNTTDSTPAQSTVQQHHEEQPMSNISPDDFHNILAENGFQEPVYEEAEEVTDEEDEEGYDENMGEGRDLDAEEDADWDALNQIQAVQSVNEDNHPEHNPNEDSVHFHMPNEVEITVPIIHESSQEVSQDALEAFNAVTEQTTATPSAPELIPPNSPTLLLNDATSRFSGTEWYSSIQKAKIILAGLGGIGRV